jgi:hypothetical protein
MFLRNIMNTKRTCDFLRRTPVADKGFSTIFVTPSTVEYCFVKQCILVTRLHLLMNFWIYQFQYPNLGFNIVKSCVLIKELIYYKYVYLLKSLLLYRK